MYSSALLYRAYRCESTRSGVFQFCFLFSVFFFEWKKTTAAMFWAWVYSRPWLGCLSWMLRVGCVCVCAFLLFRIQPLAVNIYLLLLLLLLFCCYFFLDKMIWRFLALTVSDNRASIHMSIYLYIQDRLYVCVCERDPMRCDMSQTTGSCMHTLTHTECSQKYIFKWKNDTFLFWESQLNLHLIFIFVWKWFIYRQYTFNTQFNCFHLVCW